MKKTFRQQGFTLVEMLVTVAIVGILAAIALPSYSHYIERGNLTQMQGELVDINNRIRKDRIENPNGYRTQKTLEDRIKTYGREADLKDKYTVGVRMPQTDSSAYNLTAVPTAGSGYKKALWMDSTGNGYKCENAAAARAFKTTGDCERIGGSKK